MARRESAEQLIAKFGDAARHSINVGARAERRAVRDFLRREIAKVEASYAKAKAGAGMTKSEKRFAFAGRIDAFRYTMGWLGGRIQRTRKPGGVGKR